MEYPKKIDLVKVITLENAEYPQREKYPNKTTVSTGLMFEHTLPKIGEPFFVMGSKLYPIFHTSQVKEIQDTSFGYVLTTLNSIYKIVIK